MEELIRLAEQTLQNLLKQEGVAKAQCYLERIERTELRFSLNEEPYMMRTVVDELSEMTATDAQRRVGRLALTSAEPNVLEDACGECAAFMREAKEEPDFDLAEVTKNGEFTAGDLKCDPKKLYSYVMQARETMPSSRRKDDFSQNTHFSKISVLVNSNGVRLAQHIGWYEIEGKKVRDLSVDIQALQSHEKPYDEQKWNDVEAEQLTEKFEGTVLLEPFGIFHLWWLTRMQMNDLPIIAGGEQKVHPWYNAIGEKRVSEKLTISENLLDPRLCAIDFFTKEGYPTQNIDYVKDGVIVGCALSASAARKLNRPCNAAPHDNNKSGRNVFIKPGDKPVKEILAGIEHGLVLRSMHCSPHEDGEMAGITYGGLLIEHGEITKKVKCMLSCNFFDILNNITAISKELYFSGEYETPWIAFEGVFAS